MGSSRCCSELEYLVLAMIARGVTSGYSMRRFLGRLRGVRWSAESGSVYRALKRLAASGLVRESRRAGSPNRQRTEYALNLDGAEALQEWLLQAPGLDDFCALDDPIRLRVHFLQLLCAEERIQVLRGDRKSVV